jgi:DNA mismatch repair protein MutL
MRIHVLSDQLASQIAAGEVVERPASVVKELVENAIDAGATTINLDIREGGRKLIQVSDNGSGIPVADIETAFLRHATSKLESAEDLTAIGTLGFRGEALAAIAAVSLVTAVSRSDDEVAGVRLTLDGGRLTSREAVGAPRGTVLSVANLFYNVPARLKFLKSVTTEKRHIDDLITRYALAYPEIRFRLTHDNRITFQSNGQGSRREVLSSIYGPDTAKQLLEIDAPAANPEGEGEAPLPKRASSIAVKGFIGPPSLNRSNRRHITLFVNGRWIQDHRLAYAVIQAYHTLLPTGRFPLAVLFLDMPATAVDVNVHPAKTEVRFHQSSHAFSSVQRAVREALVADSPIPQTTHFSSIQNSGWGGSLEQQSFRRQDASTDQGRLGLDWASGDSSLITAQSGNEERDNNQLGGGQLPIMRVVGQAGNAYIIAEGPDGLYLIDQHAAHERILYEQFMATWEENNGQEGMVAQGLVNSAAVQLSPSQATLLNDQLDLLANIGFQIEPFGPNAFMVRSIPAMLANLDPAKALLEMVEDMERGEVPLKSTIESRIILRVCKSAAIKAGQTLSHPEMEAMIRQLEQCDNPHTCPHGRPTLIHLSVTQLAREFGRT